MANGSFAALTGAETSRVSVMKIDGNETRIKNFFRKFSS